VTWRERTVARILLLVAMLVSDNAEVRDEIRHLSNHIGVHGRNADEE
jgi:hypothetical protein